MQFGGILLGACAFCIIGLLHPVVIQAEYHFGVRVWPAFLAAGLACIAGSLFVRAVIGSALLAVLGFSLLWSVRELFEQRERVKKGWFPRKPGRKEAADESGEPRD